MPNYTYHLTAIGDTKCQHCDWPAVITCPCGQHACVSHRGLHLIHTANEQERAEGKPNA